MPYLRRLTVLVLTATLSLIGGEANDDWGRVKALAKGTRVVVIQADMKSLRGSVDAATEEEIVVDGTTIPKARVVRISSHKPGRRVSNAVLLGVVGGLAGAGALRFGVACAETNDGCRNVGLFAVAGAAAGAALGALAVPDTVEVYRIKKK